MITSSNIDEKGEEMVRRLLLDISEEPDTYYSWIVKDYDEKTDRRNANTHWDLEVIDKRNRFRFMVQVKSSLKDLPTLEVKHINHWIKREIPTVLVAYIINTAEAYWLIPQLLNATIGGFSELQTYCTPNKSYYTKLDKANFKKLVATVKHFGRFEKNEINSSIHPNNFSNYSKELIYIDYSPIEKKLLNYLSNYGGEKYFKLKEIFKTYFVPTIFGVVKSGIELKYFKREVLTLFRKTFETLYANFYHDSLSSIENCLEEWSLDIHRISRETKLNIFAYNNLQDIISYSKNGDWKFIKWTHGSLWTVSNLSKFYNQDIFFLKLLEILREDTNPEVINAATYLLRHNQSSNYEDLFYSIEILTKMYSAKLDQTDPKVKAIDFHLRYAAMMHGDYNSLNWLLHVATKNDWREPLLLFNLQHAADNPHQYIRSMSLKVENPRFSEEPIVKLSQMILNDFTTTISKKKTTNT